MAIPKQDFVAVMGPSGSGKTTLNLLGGIDASEGEIAFDGKRMDDLSENKLAAFRAANVGFVFQFYNLMPMLTAAQNVELPLLLTKLGPKARRERVNTALAIVNLADRARHKPSELSGGQQQRVAIARAIVSDPKLMLCDEPTGDLDRETAEEILSMLQTLNKDLGKTIVMVTHDRKRRVMPSARCISIRATSARRTSTHDVPSADPQEPVPQEAQNHADRGFDLRRVPDLRRARGIPKLDECGRRFGRRRPADRHQQDQLHAADAHRLCRADRGGRGR
jgi:putative ABC transport system ATP-binding protein